MVYGFSLSMFISSLEVYRTPNVTLILSPAAPGGEFADHCCVALFFYILDLLFTYVEFLLLH